MLFFFADNNKLKFANGKLFHGLNAIEYANFNYNICTRDSFSNTAAVIKGLSEKCGYDEEADPM